MSDPRDTLLEAVEGACSGAIDFTKKLIAIPTENPPGNEYARCAESIARKLEQIGLEPKIVEVPASTPGLAPGYCITASHGEGERALHYHGHYDVVPRSSEGQFNPVIKGENLFGRGSSDMKSGLASMICAIQALRHSRTPLNGRVELIIVPDEETGGARGAASLSQASDFGKGSIGMLTAEPTSGAVWNASRCAISLRIRVKGKPAHVGLSCQGVNAFERMLVIAREVEKLKSEVADRETAFRIRPEAARRSILMMGGECRGGSNFNLVPGECSFTVDRRINPEEELEGEKQHLFDLFAQLRRDGIDHEVEVIQEGLSAGVPEDHPLAQTLSQTIESLTGRPPAFEMCPGLLETRFYAARGIPAMAYGPGLLSVSHGPNEFVPLRNIRQCAAVYALTAAMALATPR